MKILKGQVAVIFGGTFGVGRGIASALAHYGARVLITGRSVRDGAPIDEHITGIQQSRTGVTRRPTDSKSRFYFPV